jgi:hypothetical protein
LRSRKRTSRSPLPPQVSAIVSRWFRRCSKMVSPPAITGIAAVRRVAWLNLLTGPETYQGVGIWRLEDVHFGGT